METIGSQVLLFLLTLVLFSCQVSGQTEECRFREYTDPWLESYYLKSPGYDDGTYPPGMDCYYYVQFREKLVANVQFRNIDLDDDSNGTCNDYIEVFDGPTVAHASRGRFCNLPVPRSLTLSQNTVLLHFHSDNVTNDAHRGVYLQVYAHGPEHIVHVNGSSGVIRSPGYPNLYANETDYTWIITVLPYQSITLMVSNYTKTRRGRCYTSESLVVSYSTPGSSYSIRENCYGSREKVYATNANVMKVTLQTVNNISNGLALEASWTAACRRNFTRKSGIIRSPEYPNPYPANLDCVYIIERESGYYFNLTFTSFNLDSGEPCDDYVQVRDGNSENSPLVIPSSCGSSLPRMVTSSSNALYIKFHSDNHTKSTSTGFVATYTSGIKECKTKKLTSSEGTFASPGYPAQHVKHTHCVWTITVPRGRVELTFQHFAVGQKYPNRCYGAYVRIYDGDDENAKTIDTFCGATEVPKINSTGRSLTVSLYSLGWLPFSSNGFQASYRSVFEDSCSEVSSDRCESDTVHDCSGTPNTRCQKSSGGYTCVCREGYSEDSTGACVAVTRLGFTVKVNINIPEVNLTREPSRSAIKNEGLKQLKDALKPYVPTLLSVSIHNMRAGSVIADVDVEVPSKSVHMSASNLSAALVSITGRYATVAGQTGTVGITVDGMQITLNTTACDVFSRYVTCGVNQVCNMEYGRPQCGRASGLAC